MYEQETKDCPPYASTSTPSSSSTPVMQYQRPDLAAGSGYGVDQANVRFYPAPIPLRDLGHIEAIVDCPYCGARGTTKAKAVAGNMNHAWAACLFFPTVVCTWVPYMFNGLKNVEHSCRGCGKKLALWHRSGRTETR